MNLFNQKKSVFFFSALILLGLLFYIKTLFIYFVQDDFWLLSISQAQTVVDFLLFFIPRADAVWYRPLSSQVFFFFGRLFFGLHPLPFHLVVLLTHLMTVYLLYLLVKQIHHDQRTAYIAAAIYGWHQIHTVSLSWLATYSFVLGPLILVTLLLCYEHKLYRRALIFFLLGLFTSEVMIIVPFILLTREWLLRKRIELIRLMPYLILSGVVLWLRFVLFPSEVKTSLYHITVSTQFMSLVKFYTQQLIGVPMLVKDMVLWLKVVVYALVSCFAVIVISGICISFKNKSFQSFALWIAVSFWGVLLFLFLPEHLAPHYMAFSLIGVAPLLAILVVESSILIPMKQERFFLLIVLGMFLGLHFIASRWTYQTHWIFRRANLAKQLVKEKKTIHPVGSEEYFSLGADAATKVFDEFKK